MCFFLLKRLILSLIQHVHGIGFTVDSCLFFFHQKLKYFRVQHAWNVPAGYALTFRLTEPILTYHSNCQSDSVFLNNKTLIKSFLR